MSAGRWTSSGPDFSQQYRDEAQQLARRFAVMEGVVGVLLTGGLTVGEADRYSDIDLFVYLRQQSLRTWYFGEAPLPEGESRYHELRLDVSYLDYEHEREREWSTTEQWSAFRAEILYDPEGLLAELLEEKRPTLESITDKALDVATRIRFLLERQVPAWLYRGEALAAHQVLNLATADFIRLIHLINGTPEPEAGWDIALLEALEKRPAGLRKGLQDVLQTGTLTARDASRRRYALLRLLQGCWTFLENNEPFEDRAEMVRQRRMLRDLVHRESMPLTDFRELYEPNLLIQSPAFELIWLDRESDELLVRFNQERLQHLVQLELGRFLDEQQRLLRELAEASGTDVDS
jgi:predicted nucleotidyltransferase